MKQASPLYFLIGPPSGVGWLFALGQFRFSILWLQFRHRDLVAQSRKQIPLMAGLFITPKGRKTVPQAGWSFEHLPQFGV
ncbi:MAG: hypothetical protein JNJ76_01590 [Candidatus Competibacter sp.]|nr:hypothetical protein [Candidatus Competibacter sp.]